MLRRTLLLCQNKKNTADVVIIGSGIIGAYTALELARTSSYRKILVLDENPKVGAGSTCFSSGIVRAFYSVRETAQLAYESYYIWENIEDWLKLKNDDDAIATMKQVPGWFPTTERSAFLDNFAKVAEDLKIPVEALDAQQTREFAQRIGGWNVDEKFALRRVDSDDFATAVSTQRYSNPTSIIVPKTGYVSDPGLATVNAAKAAMQVHGGGTGGGEVEFRCNSRVTKINKKSGGAAVSGVTCVSSTGDVFTVESPIVINCAGPASSSVARMAFQDASVQSDQTLTTRPLRAEVAIIPMPKPAGITNLTNQVITFDTETGYYLRPEGKDHYCVGGLDLPGDPHELEYTNVGETRASSIQAEEEGPRDGYTPGEQVMIHIARMAVRMPEVRIPTRPKFITSYYDCTEDWTPICDATSLPGYYAATGTSGNCFKIAPLIGKLMVAAIEDKPSISLPLSTPAGKSAEFPRAVFSRNRKPCSDSSNSVIG